MQGAVAGCNVQLIHMGETIVPQPTYQKIERIWIGTGRFLKERAERSAARSMHLYDEVITPKLEGKPKEIAEQLRPVVEKAARFSGWSNVASEIYLAGIGVGLSVVLVKSIKDQGIGKTLMGDPAHHKRGLVHIPISASEAVVAALRRKQPQPTEETKPREPRETSPPPPPPPEKPRLFPLSGADRFAFTAGMFSPTRLRNLDERGLRIYMTLFESDIKDSTLRLDRMSPMLLKHLGAVIALLPTEDMRKIAIRHLTHGGLLMWDNYRHDHPPEKDQWSIRNNHVHFDTFYNWLRSQQGQYDARWIDGLLGRAWRSVPDLLDAFARETGYSLRAHLALRDESAISSIAEAIQWLKFWYDAAPYEV